MDKAGRFLGNGRELGRDRTVVRSGLGTVVDGTRLPDDDLGKEELSYREVEEPCGEGRIDVLDDFGELFDRKDVCELVSPLASNVNPTGDRQCDLDVSSD